MNKHFKGRVVKYDEARGFGFIRSKMLHKDAFFHIRDVRKTDFVAVGQKVMFELIETPKGYAANSVKLDVDHKFYSRMYFIIIMGLVAISTMSFSIIGNDIKIYMVIVNLITFSLYGYDKYLSTTKKIRVPESLFHTLAMMGGSVFAYIAQVLFNHKTKKQPFQAIYLVICISQIVGMLVYITPKLHKITMVF